MSVTIEKKFCAAVLLSLILCLSSAVSASVAHAQDWVWTREVVDSDGTAMSLAADRAGNIHLSYSGEGGLKYAYLPASTSQWFTMRIGGGVHYTNIKTDQQGHPHLCATYLTLPLRYAHYDGKKWDIQEIAPEDNMSVQAQCSVAIAPDGTPHLAWYRLPVDDVSYKHLRYAVLKNGVWLMRTLDFDMQTGKWNWMVVDNAGNPDISYDAFVKGALKFAHWDGKEWNIQLVDYRGAHGADYNLGMGSSVFLDSQGNPHISYYSDSEIRHAWQESGTWRVEAVEQITPTGSFADYRSSILFDKDGVPHISYEDFGVLKHAYKIGDHWHIQVIAPRGARTSRFSSMAIDLAGNIVYIAYKDPLDGSVKVAVGRKSGGSETAASQQDHKN